MTICVLLLTAVLGLGVAAPSRPHIVVIMADDLGWNDVSYHGSDQIPTPNIDALAFNGVILNSHYTQSLCTPSRAALLTGRYPLRNGMQHNVILEPEPWGLPLAERLLPQHLKRLGYATHAVGKWHLGFFRKEYTPTYRGFDSHFGFWNGYQDYFNHSVQATFVGFEGYDMRRGLRVAWDAAGKYSTRLFTDEAVAIIDRHDADRGPLFLYLAHLAPHAGNYEAPFQAPEEDVAKFQHIQNPERRVYAAMVTQLDRSVGALLSALDRNAMLRDAVVVFLSDNGAVTQGIHANSGSNWPLKGVKGTPWEGAIRTVACVWSATLQRPARVSNQLMHITDWLPSLYSAAGGDVSDLGSLDGVDMWPALVRDLPSPRKQMLVNMDDVTGYAAIRLGNLKYVNGTTLLGFQDDWFGDSGGAAPGQAPYDPTAVLTSDAAAALLSASWAPPPDRETLLQLRDAATVRCDAPAAGRCDPLTRPCLFDVARDPCERQDLFQAGHAPRFERLLRGFRARAVAPGNVRADRRADPALWNGTWTNWGDLLASGPSD